MATTPPPSLKTKTDKIIPSLSFAQAIPFFLNGRKLTRLSWGDTRSYYFLDHEIISVHKAGEALDVVRPVILNQGDFMGEDWIVLED